MALMMLRASRMLMLLLVSVDADVDSNHTVNGVDGVCRSMLMMLSMLSSLLACSIDSVVVDDAAIN
jgi:hypothetical protein